MGMGGVKASRINYCVRDGDTQGQEAIHPVTTVFGAQARLISTSTEIYGRRKGRKLEAEMDYDGLLGPPPHSTPPRGSILWPVAP